MKSIKLAQNSWHARLAFYYGPLYEGESVDICRYARAVLRGMLPVLGLIVAGAAYAASWMDFFIWAYVSLTMDSVPRCGFGVAAPALTGIFGSILGVAYGMDKYHHSNITVFGKIGHGVADSFVGSAYRSFKDKFCAYVEFV